MTRESDNDHTPIDLHWHTTRHEQNSILMSRDGIRGHAFHIPKSIILNHLNVSTSLVKVGNEPSRKGQFHVQRWKLKQLGWLQAPDVNQSAFAFAELAHGKTYREQGGSSA